MKSSSKGKTYLTGSRKTDFIMFSILACLLLISSYRIRAYYQVTVADVNLVRINPDGERIDIPTTNFIRLFALASRPPEVLWDSLQSILESFTGNYMRSDEVKAGTQFNWIIRYSYNSTKLQDERIISFKKGTDQDVHK
jgi:hypothetical protein